MKFIRFRLSLPDLSDESIEMAKITDDTSDPTQINLCISSFLSFNAWGWHLYDLEGSNHSRVTALIESAAESIPFLSALSRNITILGFC